MNWSPRGTRQGLPSPPPIPPEKRPMRLCSSCSLSTAMQRTTWLRPSEPSSHLVYKNKGRTCLPHDSLCSCLPFCSGIRPTSSSRAGPTSEQSGQCHSKDDGRNVRNVQIGCRLPCQIATCGRRYLGSGPGFKDVSRGPPPSGRPPSLLPPSFPTPSRPPADVFGTHLLILVWQLWISIAGDRSKGRSGASTVQSRYSRRLYDAAIWPSIPRRKHECFTMAANNNRDAFHHFNIASQKAHEIRSS